MLRHPAEYDMEIKPIYYGYREVFTFQPIGSDYGLFSWVHSDPITSAIKLIDELFVIDDYSETLYFLRNNPHLLEIIISAYKEIQKRFEGSFYLKLELDQDEDKIYLLIVCSSDYDLAYSNLEKLDKEWWYENVLRTGGKMNIDVEFE